MTERRVFQSDSALIADIRALSPYLTFRRHVEHGEYRISVSPHYMVRRGMTYEAANTKNEAVASYVGFPRYGTDEEKAYARGEAYDNAVKMAEWLENWDGQG